ncbi:MAG TPA: hypothetical protein VJN96_00250 [Vicinamibacterales bacterium]|nr:hypothetical protein [Vicinamibacterales bacterium]
MRDEAQAFAARKPHQAVLEPDPDNGGTTCRVRAVVRDEPPLEWAPLVGDLFHNLRSVLDHLIWELAIGHYHANPATVPVPDEKIAFPIRSSAPKRDSRSWTSTMACLAPEVQAIVERFQPFVAAPGDAEANALDVLARLDNRDKHRRLNLAFVQVNDVRITYRLSDGSVRAMVVRIADIAGPQSFLAFYDGAILLKSLPLPAEVPGAQPVPISTVDVQLNPEIAFSPEVKLKYSAPLFLTAERCIAAVEEVVASLAPFMPNEIR